MKLTTRQQQIIDQALDQTAERGIQSLTMRNIAQALGISEPALYRHFKNKAEIIKTMISRFEVESDVAMSGGVRGGIDGVGDILRSRFALVSGKPSLAKVMFSEELFRDDPEYVDMMRAMMHRHKEQLAEQFSQARAAGELRTDIAPDMLFRICLGPVRLLIKQWGMSGYAFDLKDKGEELWQSLHTLIGAK